MINVNKKKCKQVLMNNNNNNNNNENPNNYDKFLMNKMIYERYLNSNGENKKKKYLNLQKERNFYKKRILSLTKNLLNEPNNEKNIPLYLSESYINYVNSCIDYFKSTDKKDIVQMEYKNLSENNKNNLKNNTCKVSDVNNEFCNIIKNNSNSNIRTIENCINIKKKKNNKKIHIPIQKTIDLKNPLLQNKGVENKNIRFKVEY